MCGIVPINLNAVLWTSSSEGALAVDVREY